MIIVATSHSRALAARDMPKGKMPQQNHLRANHVYFTPVNRFFVISKILPWTSKCNGRTTLCLSACLFPPRLSMYMVKQAAKELFQFRFLWKKSGNIRNFKAVFAL